MIPIGHSHESDISFGSEDPLKGPNFWPIANLNSNRRDCYLYFAGDGNRRPISRQDDLRAARDPTSENNACPQGEILWDVFGE
jgi:hypothetical protein